MRRPLGVGTGSLAIVAALPEEEIQVVLTNNQPRFEEYGVSGATLQAQARKAQKLGYSMREAPTLAGVRSVGHAIRNQSGTPFAALSVSTISSRMTEKRVIEIAALLKNEVRLIEKQLSNGM